MNPWKAFSDNELEALRKPMDTLYQAVRENREPEMTLVHQFGAEYGHRRNAREIAERRAQRADACPDCGLVGTHKLQCPTGGMNQIRLNVRL